MVQSQVKPTSIADHHTGSSRTTDDGVATTTNAATTTTSTNTNEDDDDGNHGDNGQDETTCVPDNLCYRRAGPTDILKCAEIGPSTKLQLQYWQHHASPYFWCAVLRPNSRRHDDDDVDDDVDDDDDQVKVKVDKDDDDDQQPQKDHDDHRTDEDDIIVGFISGIRLDDETLGPDDAVLVTKQPHNPAGSFLAIRAVVVRNNNDDDDDNNNDSLRRAMMEHYVSMMRHVNTPEQRGDRPPMTKLVALCPLEDLPLYLECGFSVVRPSRAVRKPKSNGSNNRTMHKNSNGKSELPIPDQLYYLELSLVNDDKRRTCNQLFGSDGGQDCYVVDSFANRPGTGNPAAVVLLKEDFTNGKEETKWMQMVAAEFNLAETAFCWPHGITKNEQIAHAEDEVDLENDKDDGDSVHWNIRYFTPTVEMSLCGHATLASAAVLYQTLSPSPTGRVIFHASQDVVTMRLAVGDAGKAEGRTSRISMDFPPKPATELSTREDKAAVRNMLNGAFGTDLESAMLFVGISDLGDLLVELTPQAFADIGYDTLDFKAFLEWDGYYRGIVICCIASKEWNGSESNGGANDDGGPQVDFLSRFFAPKAGIDEDPVTGSAHCILGPYFATKLNKDAVVGRQVSKRSGVIECEVTPETVTLTGSAVITMNGRLHM